MSELIEHVSDTAFWVAYFRWVETQRKDALFRDPLAIKLCGERGVELARRMGIERAMAWSMALRTWIIDRYILDAIQGGVDMVVNLGAGLDTRPYRLDISSDFQWVEVDFSHVVDYKNQVLADDKPICRLERIACDLSVDAEREALLARLNDRAQRILVLTEGVVPYLSNDEAGRLARDLAAQSQVEWWLTDYFSPFFLKLSARGKIQRHLAKNAPFRFNAGPEPLDWPTFFAATGWQVSDIRFSGEEGIKIGRALPAGFIARLFIRFMPEEKLRPFKRMNGYALLKKGHDVVPI
jgi:methyltransferase (TIGR00027 family)